MTGSGLAPAVSETQFARMKSGLDRQLLHCYCSRTCSCQTRITHINCSCRLLSELDIHLEYIPVESGKDSSALRDTLLLNLPIWGPELPCVQTVSP